MELIDIKTNKTVINTNPINTVTNKYTLIETDRVISLFEDKGFILSGYQEARYRKEEKRHKVRHVIRMNVKSDTDKPIQREVVIMNSHDGSSSFKLNFGAFVGVCSNQLVFGDKLLPTERIHHSTQDPWERIAEYAELIQSKLKEEEELRIAMMHKRLSAYDIEQLAYNAIQLREQDMSLILDTNAVALANRPEDVGKDLWRSFNKIQENLLNGSYQKRGIYTEPETGIVHDKYKQAKRLTNQSKIIDVNKKLHTLAMDLL